MFELVKKLLEISGDEHDDRVSAFISYTIDFICAYCRISEIPETLHTTCAMIASNLYLSFEGHSKVSIGDVSLEFQKDLKFYKNILNNYRRVACNDSYD